MKTISFSIIAEDARVINRIVERAGRLAAKYPPDVIMPVDRLSLHMDLTACHANGCPIDLPRLLTADDTTFGHDVFGVRMHIDRKTGQLDGCFLPRTARAM